MVLDCAAYNVANILVDLLDVLPGLYILSTVGSIIFLQVNKGIEMANAKADLYSSMTISDMDMCLTFRNASRVDLRRHHGGSGHVQHALLF